MSTPHIEHFTDEHGNITFRGEIGGMVLSEEEVKALGKHVSWVLDENAKLRELVSGLEHCVQGLACNCCPLYDPSGTNHRRCESLERELGIEVDG